MDFTRCSDCKYYPVEEGHWPCVNCKHGDGEEEHFSPAITARNENRCIVCNAIIPEGRHICLTCERGNDMQTFTPRPRKTPPMPPVNPPKVEAVNHPAHYQGKHECIDEMIALFGVEAVKGFCACNVYKYRYRADRKNGAEDIAKAEWYMTKLMELEGMDNE